MSHTRLRLCCIISGRVQVRFFKKIVCLSWFYNQQNNCFLVRRSLSDTDLSGTLTFFKSQLLLHFLFFFFFFFLFLPWTRFKPFCLFSHRVQLGHKYIYLITILENNLWLRKGDSKLLLDSFQTRYTYFLGQSPNFVLFRILKFGLNSDVF